MVFQLLTCLMDLGGVSEQCMIPPVWFFYNIFNKSSKVWEIKQICYEDNLLNYSLSQDESKESINNDFFFLSF